nr:protein ABHD11-like [Procambarus clarkii]
MKCLLRTSAGSCLGLHAQLMRLAATRLKIRQLSARSESYAPVSMAYTSLQQTVPEKISKEPPIIIMHGLMGSKTNWKSLGKVINAKTGRHVYTVDARNHGDSPHTSQHCYPLLAEDILFFLDEHRIPKAVLVGHSMGGRAVMSVALKKPSVVDKLFVLDVSPVGTSRDISSLPRFLEIMRRIEVPPHLNMQEARKYTDEILKPAVPALNLRQFLLTNLISTEEGYKWRLNIESIAKNFNPFISTFPILDEYRAYEGETAFIGGELSDYLRKEDEQAILELFPQSSFHYIEGAGHWLHADKPNEFLELFFSLLNS